MGWLITPAEIPATKRCFKLSIPDNEDIIAAVLGSLDELGRDSTWVQTDVANVSRSEIAEAMRDMTGEMIESECLMQVNNVQPVIQLIPRGYYVNNAGVLNMTIQEGAFLNAYFVSSTGTDGAHWRWRVVLSPGTWFVSIVYVKSSVAGKYESKLNGVSNGIADAYNAVATFNNIFSFTTPTIVTDWTECDFELSVNGKNASSTGFFLGIQHINISRTAP